MTEILNALGELWKSLFALAFLLFIVLFRKPIGRFVDRLRTVKIGDKELQATNEVEEEEEKKKEEKDTAANQQIQEEPATALSEGVPENTTDSAFDTMIKAFNDSNFELAKQAYEDLRAAQKEENSVEIDASYLYLKYTKAGDSSSLDTLRELAANSSAKARVFFWLGHCYWFTKDFSLAREVFTEARESADEFFSAQITDQIAQCWIKEGNPDQALEEVINKLREVGKPESKASLYKSLASVYQANGSDRMRAIALEKALEYTPRDTDLRFNAAYAQSQAKLSAMAISNYDTLLTIEPKAPFALNNLGVECKGLGLLFKSIEYYKKAAGEGNTLAMANLAYQFIYSGFHSEAAEELSRASQLPDPHENVTSGKAHLEKTRREESEKWDNFIDVGARQQQFLREFAQASIESSTQNLFLGTWRSPYGDICSVKSDGIRICLEFKKNGTRHNFAAQIKGFSAAGELQLWKKEWYQEEGSFQRKNDALATVTSDGENMSILELSNSSTVLRMTRVPSPT